MRETGSPALGEGMTKMKLNELIGGLMVITLAVVALPALATPSTSYYVYDESGHVIGEYDSNGNAIQEHIYLGDRPVAVVQGGSVGYVTADQLNTPRAVTDQSATLEWSWTSDPFGNGQPTGSLTYNLRFPGQYYDSETGHNYNYYRDYNPQTGRYLESDPFGLKAGINTYVYVEDMPLVLVDRFGLSDTPPPYDPTFGPSAQNCSQYPPGILHSICSGTPDNPSMNCARNCVATHYPGRWNGPIQDYVFYLIPEHPVCWWVCKLRPSSFCPMAAGASLWSI